MHQSDNPVPDTAWFKSSYSGANETECVETAYVPHLALVRDSKQPAGPRLAFSETAWNGFLMALRNQKPA
ncbi:DUF397 domain-containing protein [Streptomyces sannanensis]|uniref:DUF397 domain-containing protein n=1 Tax=Streptomyces sannanensis TaxID=285536 RepID=A0ABP6SA32_9ACTN